MRNLRHEDAYIAEILVRAELLDHASARRHQKKIGRIVQHFLLDPIEYLQMAFG